LYRHQTASLTKFDEPRGRFVTTWRPKTTFGYTNSFHINKRLSSKLFIKRRSIIPQPFPKQYSYASLPHIINRKTSGVRLEPLNRAETPFPEKRKKLFKRRKVRKKGPSKKEGNTFGLKKVLKNPTKLVKKHLSFGYESDFEDDVLNEEDIYHSHQSSERFGKNLSLARNLPFNPKMLTVIEEEEEKDAATIDKVCSATSNWTTEEYDDIEDPEWISSDQESDEEEAWKDLLHPYVRLIIFIVNNN
jgi:hypothetical protein